jgi:putative addiction module CopG family antidote
LIERIRAKMMRLASPMFAHSWRHCGARVAPKIEIAYDDAMRNLTITLPDDLAELVRQKVDSGQYENESAVVREALWALEHDIAPCRDPEIEEWLRAEVVPTYDLVEADPGQAPTVEEVKANLEVRYGRTLKDRGG